MSPDERVAIAKTVKKINSVLKKIGEVKVILQNELESDLQNEKLRNIIFKLEKEESEAATVLREIEKLI